MDTTATLTSAASSTHSINQVLSTFYESNATDVVKQSLWQLLYLALGSEEFDELTPIERSNLAFQYKEINDLLDQLQKYYAGINH